MKKTTIKLPKSLEAIKNERGWETVIVDGMGNLHEGIYCHTHCFACPYWCSDYKGDMACYMEHYEDYCK